MYFILGSATVVVVVGVVGVAAAAGTAVGIAIIAAAFVSVLHVVTLDIVIEVLELARIPKSTCVIKKTALFALHSRTTCTSYTI